MAADLDLGGGRGEPSPDPDRPRPMPRHGIDETMRMLQAQHRSEAEPRPGSAGAVEETVALRPPARRPSPRPVPPVDPVRPAVEPARNSPISGTSQDFGAVVYSPNGVDHYASQESDRPAGAADGRIGGRRGMDIRDYIGMVRRGWLMVVVITIVFVGLAGIYLAVTPPRFESGTSLFVSANDPQTIADLSQGADFSSRAVTTYAGIIQSETVLGPAAALLRPQLGVKELIAMVSTSARTETSLIDVVVASSDPAQAAAVANAVAASASRILPSLEGNVDGRPLVRVQQTRPAVESTDPVSPNLKKTLALGLVVGFLVGLGATITRQSLDTRIRRVEDLRQITDVPLLAVLPALKGSAGLAVRDEPTGVAGEAFRALRTNVRFLESAERRSLVVAAVSGDRDGAQIAANLAWSLAEAGRRVLLVDVDLRRSVVGDALGIESGVGLSDVLTGRADLPAAILPTGHAGLRVVLSGSPQPSPSDLLSTPALAGVLRRMEHENDYVILQAPPLLSCTDAAVLAAGAGGTFLTVAAGGNDVQELSTALGALSNVRVTPLGLVLTGLALRGGPGAAGGGGPRGRAPRPVERSSDGRPLRSRPAPRTAQP